jgi:shikimate kinase
MNSLGEVIWLKADPEVLYKHLLMGKTERPLLKGKSPEELITFIREQLEKREPFYSKARHVLNVNLMDTYEKINISVTKAKELLHL